MIVFNPPYGERMRISEDDFYKKIGDQLKNYYAGCNIWILSSDLDNIKFIGLKPSQKIKLFNGKLNCVLLKFEVYEGSKKHKEQ